MEEAKGPNKWLLIAHMGAGSTPKDPKKTLRVEEMLKTHIKRFSKLGEPNREDFLDFMARIEVKLYDLFV